MYIGALICEHMQLCIYICAYMLCVPVYVLRKGVKMDGEAGGPELGHRECGCSRRADKQGSLEEEGCQGGGAEWLRKAIK